MNKATLFLPFAVAHVAGRRGAAFVPPQVLQGIQTASPPRDGWVPATAPRLVPAMPPLHLHHLHEPDEQVLPGLDSVLESGRTRPKSPEPPVRAVSDPPFLEAHKGLLHYENLGSCALYPNRGALYLSLNQGGVANCFAMAAIAALAAKNEPYIKSLIQDKGDGIYWISCFAPDKTGQYNPVVVEVNARFPMNSAHQMVYAGKPKRGTPFAGPYPMWAPLIEKALVTLNEKYHLFGRQAGYEGIHHGGAAAKVLRVLIGHGGRVCATARHTEDHIWEELKAADRGDYLTCVSNAPAPQIPSPHAYAILGTSVKKGQRYVTLYNPWGFHSPGRPDAGNGVFAYPLSDFKKAFDIISIVPRNG